MSLLSMCSCLNKDQDRLWFIEKDKNYNRIEIIFKDKVDFFPKEENASCLNSTWNLNPVEEYNVKIAFDFKNEDVFNQIRNKLKECSIAEYLSSADELLVLNRFTTNKNYGYPDSDEINEDLIDVEGYRDLYPVPNFSNFTEYQSDATHCKLSDDFIILVLDAKPGKFLNEDNLTQGKYMPVDWKNGYSKGVAVSEKRKIIIYWVIIW